jgi:hypothetical protein
LGHCPLLTGPGPASLAQPIHPATGNGFLGLRQRGAFWHDNTDALARLLVNQRCTRKVLLTRPPRFGKSIFCQMLGMYVDCKTTDAVFEQCFADTKIECMVSEGDEETREALTELRRKCAWLELVRMS